MRFTLVGYMCSGKTTVGKKLAHKLDYCFLDLDDTIEKKYHISIFDFFQKYDESAFRKIEEEVLHEIIKEDNSVISTGGGTPCYGSNIDLINKNSISIFLKLSNKKIIYRIHQTKKQRPILNLYSGEKLSEFIEKHMEERGRYYKQAHYTVDCEFKNIKEITSEIMSLPPFKI